ERKMVLVTKEAPNFIAPAILSNGEIINTFNLKKYSNELNVALRASFLIDKNWIVRHQVINDLPFGRNINEIIRMIDAIEFHNKYGEVCPANWEPGKDGITTSLQGISSYLNKHFSE
ncbi:peroxiredoxin 1-like, partial [Aphis craccivora]